MVNRVLVYRVIALINYGEYCPGLGYNQRIHTSLQESIDIHQYQYNNPIHDIAIDSLCHFQCL